MSRHWRSIANLRAATSLADRVYVFDNSEEDTDASLCVRTQDGELRKVYGGLPEWVATVADKLPRHTEFVDLRGR